MNVQSKFEEIALICHRRLPEIGDVYKHFKGMKVLITAIAMHTETEEPLVIYKHDDNYFARPLEMFLSTVDKEKYPEVKQTYRLEKELPTDVTISPIFKEIEDTYRKIPEFKDKNKQELTEYILDHYFR